MKEDGVDAIAGAVYDDIDTFDKLVELTNDVVDNREDYKDLKVVIIDTLDELFTITEPYVIKLHNRQNPDKRVSTINQAMGGLTFLAHA